MHLAMTIDQINPIYLLHFTIRLFPWVHRYSAKFTVTFGCISLFYNIIMESILENIGNSPKKVQGQNNKARQKGIQEQESLPEESTCTPMGWGGRGPWRLRSCRCSSHTLNTWCCSWAALQRAGWRWRTHWQSPSCSILEQTFSHTILFGGTKSRNKLAPNQLLVIKKLFHRRTWCFLSEQYIAARNHVAASDNKYSKIFVGAYVMCDFWWLSYFPPSGKLRNGDSLTW